MRRKKDDYVNEEENKHLASRLDQPTSLLSIEEQIEMYADLIVEQLVIELNEKNRA
jgi:hypothetical protein